MFKKYLPLLLVILLSAVLRLVALDRFPAGLNADEAALGYNAYSLLETGLDEHGHFLPINLESFGDYKPALYSYLLVPLIKVFGLNEMAVRLPSAFLGIAAVFFLYVLVRLLYPDRRLALIASFFLAVSPWHLHFSRGAWEVNVSTFFLILGTVLFLRWISGRRLCCLFSAVFLFVASMYTYQSARVIAPLLGLGLVWLYRDRVLSRIRQAVSGLVLLVVITVPLIYSLLFTGAASRVGGVGLLADEGPVNFVRELRGQHRGIDVIIGKLLHNRPVIYTIQFAKNYLSHFDGNFLFVSGDVIQRNLVPETGLLYWTDFVLILIGVVFLTRGGGALSRFTFLWLFIAPAASGLTFQVPHALRAANLVIPLVVLAAAGIVRLIDRLKTYRSGLLSFVCLSLLTVIFSWQFTRYLHEYYVHYPKTYPAAWEYGFKDLVRYVSQNQNRYRQVLVTNTYDQPYILFLFYLKFPPVLFHGHHELTLRDQYNFSTVNEFSVYNFTDTSWDRVRDIHESLIVAAPKDLPGVGVNIVKTIYFPGGQPAFQIVSN